MIAEQPSKLPPFSLLKHVDQALNMLPQKTNIDCHLCGSALEFGQSPAGKKFIHCIHCGFHWPKA